MNAKTYDVLVVGGGAAGVGVSIALKHAGIENFRLLDRSTIGASFASWPAETCFITPSFPTNSIGMLDLNSIAIGVSPAFSLGVEHPTGEEYAAHLRGVAEFFELPIFEHTDVKRVTKVGEDFRVDTTEETLRAKHVIWAAGEFQYPRLNGFVGSELCRHTATIPSYEELEGDDFVIVGGYESGVDAAYHLAYRDKRVRLFDKGCPWDDESSDPSVALSTYSRERMQADWFVDQVELFPETPIASVAREGAKYEITTQDGRRFQTSVSPLLAGGFEGSHKLVADLFERREDGYPLLSEHDESTIVRGVFLCGPAVRHENHVFCFIYKYRQRLRLLMPPVRGSCMKKLDLERYRQQLLAMRARLRGDTQSLSQRALDAAANSRMPIHMAERGTDEAARECDLMLSQQEASTLDRIEAALERIEEGVFGICLATGKPIPKARLDAVPYAEFCVKYAEQLERDGRSAGETNFRGSTVIVERYRSGSTEYIDTPGILRSSDTETTRLALSALAENDVVLLVVQATSLDQDLSDMLPLVIGKQGAMVVTYWDKVQQGEAAQEAIERLAADVGVKFITLDARQISGPNRQEIANATINPSTFRKASLTARAGWRIEPKPGWMEHHIVGPLLAVLLLFLPALATIYGANKVADLLHPIVARVFEPAIATVNATWPSWLRIVLTAQQGEFGYGLLNMGPFLLVWAFPTVLMFALILGVYKASGLIERMNVALHPLMRPFGLSGRDVVRVMIGFGCNVPAVISTRSCSSCSRGPAISAIAFGSACSYQLPATLAVLSGAAVATGTSAVSLTGLFLTYLLITTLVYLRLTSSSQARSSLNVLMTPSRPFMQWPTWSALWREASGTVRQFLLQAMPVFILICIAASLLAHAGVLDMASRILGPVMGAFDLPSQAALPVVLASVRKDGIFLLAADDGPSFPMTAAQALTAVYLAGVLLPCLVTAMTIGRETGWKPTSRLLARQARFAILFALILAWGSKWPQGNWLLELGFDRIEPPVDRDGCSSVYTLMLPCQRCVVLRGFGVFYGAVLRGGIFLPRFEFLPRYTTHATLELPPWSDEDLPKLSVPKDSQQCDSVSLTLELIDWIRNYESTIVKHLGVEYRRSTLLRWDNGKRTIVPAEEMARAWRLLGISIAEDCRVLFSQCGTVWPARRFGGKLMEQQVWCWGRDVEYSDGNLLVGYGFERHRDCSTDERSTCYRLDRGQIHIALWGFGMFYGCRELGGLYLSRFELFPTWAPVESLALEIHWPEDLPVFARPRGMFEWRCARKLWKSSLLWIANYETWVRDTVGLDYRRDCVKTWLRPYVRADKAPAAWRFLSRRGWEHQDQPLPQVFKRFTIAK
ncbi:unnamed protein product [Cladocopium goreaui]|uniref:Flavoprotein monooxygenase (Baeyer-Villiger flavin-containing monooxygenase) (BVFMO) (Baeyer-Villiger monooxygenase) (BVMO) (Flavin-containing monooxygenase) (FMO) (SAFMO) n=1 Tax=Cladocopium goreaui TaxID=2562237 RepID=A0A9P1BFG0_9DINO|nr:unnamed protein product [Cladocopium goreaui]